YIALFSKSSFYLPKNLLFVNYKENCSSYLNDDLTFYGISNNKWLIKKSFSTLNIKHNIDGIVFLELDKMVTSYKYPVFYFNFQNSKFDSTLLNIDYLYEISYDLKLVCKEKNHTRLISSTCYPETKRDVVFPKLFYKNQYDRIVDSNIENLDYFEYNNKLYRFKMVDIPENGFDMFFLYCDYIESYKIYNAVYSYESVLYYNHDPDQTIVIDNNCQDINFVKIFKDVFFYSFLIIFLILTIKIIIYLNNKKNKK
ncbi:MAG: hypothetical protein IKJ03_01395, partial [Mycoplasmataceae bacterium]|nr:hypothetical protein [Mycoplasmataceae bacterium]